PLLYIFFPHHPIHTTFFSHIPHPLIFTLFPYTTLFRSYWNLDSDRLILMLSIDYIFWLILIKLINSMEILLVQNVKMINSVMRADRKSTRLNSSHLVISYAVFCLKKKIE